MSVEDALGVPFFTDFQHPSECIRSASWVLKEKWPNDSLKPLFRLLLWSSFDLMNHLSRSLVRTHVWTGTHRERRVCLGFQEMDSGTESGGRKHNRQITGSRARKRSSQSAGPDAVRFQMRFASMKCMGSAMHSKLS